MKYKVKKLILTSSIATVNGLNYKGREDTYYDETCFSHGKPHQNIESYSLSKQEQEQECIRFLKEMQERKEEFIPEIVTLHPSFIVGPVLNHLESSTAVAVKAMCIGKIPFLPRMNYPFIDVRDCAQAHINALVATPGTL